MTITSTPRPKAEVEIVQPTTTAEPAIQERIDAMIAEAVKNAPKPLSVEEQRKKNQAALAVLRQWDEEDAMDDPEELAQREADWQEFKKGMNENSLSGRIVYPAEDYP